MAVITVENHGPLITASNYWGSKYAAAGKLYVSVNAGAIRVLVPASARADRGVQEQSLRHPLPWSLARAATPDARAFCILERK